MQIPKLEFFSIIGFILLSYFSYASNENYRESINNIKDIFFKIEPTKYKCYQNSILPNFDFLHKYIAEEKECFEYCDNDKHCKWCNIVINKDIGHCWLSRPSVQKGTDTYIKISYNNYIVWNNTDIKGFDIYSQHADTTEDCITICDSDLENCQFFNIKIDDDESYICYFKKLHNIEPKSEGGMPYFAYFILIFLSIVFAIGIIIEHQKNKWKYNN